MIPQELKNKIHVLFREKKSIAFVSDLYGLDHQTVSNLKQIYARETYTPRAKLSEAQKALIRAHIEKDEDDSHISRALNIDRLTVRRWRLHWGYKSSKFASLEDKRSRAKEAYYRGHHAWIDEHKAKEPIPRGAIIQRVVWLGSGEHVKPVFPKPKAYNDYLKKEYDRARPMHKNTYRPRFHVCGPDVVIPV